MPEDINELYDIDSREGSINGERSLSYDSESCFISVDYFRIIQMFVELFKEYKYSIMSTI